MRKPEDYKTFQDRIFQEIDEIEARKSLILVAAEEYGLTWADVRRICKPGMDGRQLDEAMRAEAEAKGKGASDEAPS